MRCNTRKDAKTQQNPGRRELSRHAFFAPSAMLLRPTGRAIGETVEPLPPRVMKANSVTFAAASSSSFGFWSRRMPSIPSAI